MNKKTFIKLLAPLLIFFVFPIITQAQLVEPSKELSSVTNEFAQTAKLSNVEPSALVAGMIKLALSFLAVIFLVIIILSGVKWMTAGGDEESVRKAKTTLQNAVIGLLIVFAAYAITYFIFNEFPLGSTSAPQAV